MTSLLSKAFKKASALPDSIQNELARELIEEINWEKKWENTLKKSTPHIDNLAEQALREFKDGKTTEIGFDSL